MAFIALCLLMYFLPSIIGHSRRDFAGIFILNLLLGWTVIGWIAALIWACASDRRYPVLIAAAPSAPAHYYCCQCGAASHAGSRFCWSCGRAL
ncbi:MAG TPA: superinfection immunity protein [Candidatus Acidoferrales bacterium]|nr:superinfection immunity protein [Candidatus Acidoferrales bacterium]